MVLIHWNFKVHVYTQITPCVLRTCRTSQTPPPHAPRARTVSFGARRDDLTFWVAQKPQCGPPGLCADCVCCEETAARCVVYHTSHAGVTAMISLSLSTWFIPHLFRVSTARRRLKGPSTQVCLNTSPRNPWRNGLPFWDSAHLSEMININLVSVCWSLS